MGRFRTFSTILVATALAVIASSLVVGATAQAASMAPTPTELTGCGKLTHENRKASTSCSGGTGLQRATATCYSVIDGSTKPATPGRWVGPLAPSVATCEDKYYIDNVQVELQRSSGRPGSPQ